MDSTERSAPLPHRDTQSCSSTVNSMLVRHIHTHTVRVYYTYTHMLIRSINKNTVLRKTVRPVTFVSLNCFIWVVNRVTGMVLQVEL